MIKSKQKHIKWINFSGTNTIDKVSFKKFFREHVNFIASGGRTGRPLVIEGKTIVKLHLHKYNLTGVQFKFCRFVACKFEGCNLENSVFLGCELNDCSITGGNFKNIHFEVLYNRTKLDPILPLDKTKKIS